MLVKSLNITLSYYNSALVRVIADENTPHNTSCCAPLTKERPIKEGERWSVREIKCEQKREEKQPQTKERERDRGMFYMMRFASATFSFLASLVIKSCQKKMGSAKFKRKFSNFRSEKKLTTISCLWNSVM